MAAEGRTLQNSLLISLLAGNLVPETGSQLTASSASQSGLWEPCPARVSLRDIPAAYGDGGGSLGDFSCFKVAFVEIPPLVSGREFLISVF
jgi:hypothetical protein